MIHNKNTIIWVNREVDEVRFCILAEPTNKMPEILPEEGIDLTEELHGY